MIMRNLFLLLFLCYLHLAISFNVTQCDVINQMYLDIVKRKLAESYQKSKDECITLSSLRQPVFLKGRDWRLHIVCYDPDLEEKIMFVETTISHADMAHGTTVNANVRKLLRQYSHKCGSDDMGHIVPQEFGGHGTITNIFLQNLNLNRGLWVLACREVKKFLLKDKTRKFHAHMRIAFEYGDINYPRRPSIFYYAFAFFDSKKFIHQTFGFFENNDHMDSLLTNCWKNQEKYVYVAKLTPEYFERRGCAPDPKPNNVIYGPSLDNN